MKSFIFVVLAIFGTVQSASVSYEGCHVYRMIPHNNDQVKFLKSLDTEVDFWKECSLPERTCDLLLSPKQQSSLLPKIESLGISVETFVDDVGSLAQLGIHDPVDGLISWDSYYSLEDINTFLNDQATSHSSIASVINMGPSFERRNLTVIKIAKNSTRKPIIFVEANVHAREWITNAVATYLINELLNGEDPDVKLWTEDFDWYILPVFNVDGYVHTRNLDRMWRKNRAITSSPLCRGVDLNRNFDYNWCGVGSTPEPCSETHCGTAPNSEPETQALVNFVETLADNLVFYLSVHSYSQYIMFPYGDKRDNSFYDSHMRVARDAATAAARRYGTVFTPGNWKDILYESTGVSADWAKEKLNVSLALTYELRDQGRFGFLLPPEQIIPSALEFLDSLKPIMEALRNGIP